MIYTVFEIKVITAVTAKQNRRFCRGHEIAVNRDRKKKIQNGGRGHG